MKTNNLKIKNKRILSLLLAFGFTLMPISKGNTEYKDNQMISIFDEDNSKSNQYGANQRAFGRCKYLLNNQYIWDELQEYFPVESFSCQDEAISFYKSYFKIISKCGCGYAVACDFIFQAFEGREDEFLEHFGYPMYTIDENGAIDFNYEVFMLKFFNYSVIKMDKSEARIKRAMQKDLYNYELNAYVVSEDFLRKKPSNMTEDELREWKEFDNNRMDKYYELYNRWQNATNEDINFGISLSATFGYLYNYLANFHLIVDVEMLDVNEYNVGDIIACERFDLYTEEEERKDFNEYSKMGSHYLYVTDITDDGKVVVSSWGKKFYLDDSNALWSQKILLKKNRGF